MRLRNIYILCRNNIGNVLAVEGSAVVNNSGYTAVIGWKRFVSCYQELTEIEYLKVFATEVFENVPEIYRHQDSFKLTNAEWVKVRNSRDRLADAMHHVMRLYESMGLSGDECNAGLDIKLPACEDFGELRKCIEELDFILYRCPLFQVDGELLKLQAFDVGSFWLNFAVTGAVVNGATKILRNIAAFIDQCFKLKSHKITIDEQLVHFDTMEMEKEQKKIVQDAMIALYKKQVDLAIAELEGLTQIKVDDGEKRDLVAKSFERTIALLDKGMQMNATLDSAKEIQVLFDAVEPNYHLASKETQMLEKKEEE